MDTQDEHTLLNQYDTALNNQLRMKAAMSPEHTKLMKKFDHLRALLDPTTRERRVSLPVGPDNEQNFRTLTSTTYVNLSTATSGNGLILTYPGLPFVKFGEHWVDDGSGNLIFKDFIVNAVNPSKQHTYGRVVRSVAEFKSGFQSVMDNGSISGGVQGQWAGTVVEGGIAQLYKSGLSSSEVFSLANLSQLTANDNYKLLGTSGADGIAYNQPPLNTPFLRLSDAVPATEEPGSNRNVDWSLQDVEIVNQNFDRAPNWDGGVINFGSSVLEKEYKLGSIGIDMPYHGEILSNLSLSVGRIAATGGISSGIFYQLWADLYGLDRLTPDKSYEIVKGTIDINTLLNTDVRIEGAGFKIIPDLDDDEMHVTWTAVKMRLRIYIIETPSSTFTLDIAAQAATKVTQPLYCGRGMVQRPTLFIYSELGAEAPIVGTVKNRYELTPDTDFSRIIDSEPRIVSYRTYKLLTKITSKMPTCGLSWFYTPGSTRAATSTVNYVKDLVQLIAIVLASYYKNHAESLPLDYDHHFASKLNLLKKIGKTALKVAKPVYNNGGRNLIKNLVPAEYRPAADVILPKHFASGVSFASGNSFATKLPKNSMKDNAYHTIAGFTNIISDNEDDPSLFVFDKEIEPEFRNNPGVFVPSVNRQGRHLLGDVWYLTEMTNKLLDWFDKTVAKKGSYKNWSQINSNHVIYGHTGEKFFNPQIKKSLILLHVCNIEPLTFDFSTVGDGDSLGLAVQALTRVKGPLNAAFSGAVHGNEVVELEPVVAYCKFKASKHFGLPLICNSNISDVVKVTKVSNLNSLKTIGKGHSFSSPNSNTPGLSTGTRGRGRRNNTRTVTQQPKSAAKVQPKNQPKQQPRERRDRIPDLIPRDWTEADHQNFVFHKINNQLAPTGRFMIHDIGRFQTVRIQEYLVDVVNILKSVLTLNEPDRSLTYRGIVAASGKACFERLLHTGIVYHSGFGYSDSKYKYTEEVYRTLQDAAKKLTST